MIRNVELARTFLRSQRIALVGASRDPKDFSRKVMDALVAHGHDVVPVNPAAEEIGGRRAFHRMQDVAPPAEAALFMTPPPRTAAGVEEALAAGVRQIWLHRGGGSGAATAEAIALCRAAGVEPVTDLCPFMLLDRAAFPHRLHGFFRRRAVAWHAARAVPP